MNNQTFNGSKVPWVVFVAIITIFVAAMGWVFTVGNRAEAIAQESLGRVAGVEGDIKAINVNLANIASSIARLESKIK